MTPTEVLSDGFARIPAIMGRATTGLNASRLATRPAAGTNTIAWLVWHAARGQDAWVSDLAGTEAVWRAGEWYEAFLLPFPAEENGFGMHEDDTALVVAPAELLAGYLDAVTGQTLAYLATLGERDLDHVVDDARSPVVTRGIRLMSVLDDGLQHAGQAGYARGILDRSPPSARTSVR